MPLFLRLLPFMLIFQGCRAPLSVRTENIDRAYLASSIILTPDPQLNNPPIGQKLVVDWKILNQLVPATLFVTIRFANGEEILYEKEVCSYFDTAIISHLNEDFFTRGWIVTYKAEIFRDSACIASFYHHMWTEKIVLDYNK
jgi:hypothetical protein